MNANNNLAIKFKLSDDQIILYEWLKTQNINTDDNTLIFWVKTYSLKRLKEVVNFANARKNAGQNIRNLGGWIHQFLKSNQPVVNDLYAANRNLSQEFSKHKNWKSLKIYEKYVRDTITGDDLSLSMNTEEFKRALEALYQRSEIYK